MVPAPALPTWPPSTTGAPQSGGSGNGNSRGTGSTGSPSAGSAGQRAGSTDGGRHDGGFVARGAGNAGAGRHDGGSDLAGTVYGSGDGPGFTTIAMPANAVENSGSLTGHILAQGWADTPAERSRNTRVMIVLAAALGLLVAISVMVVLLAGDALDGLVGSVLKG
ncbi:hypothetical protein AB0B57_13535 [Micromonospora sp. NPDC049101]|uniref:hypothetical protein n=1 Tax=Micromonospora sp. NPDC049101 TaxID=3155032 RepID=UPI0033C36B58